MRYFELKPFNLIYFESEELRHLPRKEFQITSESKVVAVYKSDSATRYSFKVSNQWDVLTLGASTEAERDSWIQNINLAISYVSNCMFGYMVLIRPLLKNHRDKYYFIFGNGLISMHSNEKQTSDVDGTFRFSNETVLDEVDDYNKIITLSDHSSSTYDLKTISFVFSYADPNSKFHPSQLYKNWKAAIIRAIRPDALKKSVLNVRKDRDVNGISIKMAAGVGKVNALEVVSNRRNSLQRDNYAMMNGMKAIDEAYRDDIVDDNDDFNAVLERPSFLALPPPPPPPPHLSRPLPSKDSISTSISTTIPSSPIKASTDGVHQSSRDASNLRPLPPQPPITSPMMNAPHLSSSGSRPPPPRPPSVMAPPTNATPQSSSTSRPLPPQPLLSTAHHLSSDSTVPSPSHQSINSSSSPPPPPPPPLSRQSSAAFTYTQSHDSRPPPPTSSSSRTNPTDTHNADDEGYSNEHSNSHLSIDAYYDGKQSSTSDSFKGEMTSESRANLKLQLARLKDSSDQSNIANARVSSPAAKAEVNPLLHSFQAHSNPLSRQRSPVGKTDIIPTA